MRPVRPRLTAMILFVALALLAPAARPRPARAATVATGTGSACLRAECTLSLPEPTKALEGLDHLVSMLALVNFKAGPFYVKDWVEFIKLFLRLDRLAFTIDRAKAPDEHELVLACDFHAGFAPADALAPVLALVTPWVATDLKAGTGTLRPGDPKGFAAAGLRPEGSLRVAGRRATFAWRFRAAGFDLEPIADGRLADLQRRAGPGVFFTLLAGPSKKGAAAFAAGLGLPVPAWKSLGAAVCGSGRVFSFLFVYEPAAGAAGDAYRQVVAFLSTVRAAEFEKATPADIGLLAIAGFPDFSVFNRLPRTNGLAGALWFLGLSPERELAPLAKPRLALALRQDSSLFDLFGGRPEPGLALLLEKAVPGDGLHDLIRARIDSTLNAAGDNRTRSVVLEGRPLRGWELSGLANFDVELFSCSLPTLYAVGHGFDLAEAFARTTAEATAFAATALCRELVPPDAPVVLYVDFENVGPLIVQRATATWGAFDRRTRDVAKAFDSLRALGLSLRYRAEAFEARLALAGKARP